MTTKEKLIQMCVDNGMFEEDASKVLDIAMVEIDKDSRHNITWNRPDNEYPDALYTLLFMTVKIIALKWIDKNIPQAFYRQLFI